MNSLANGVTVAAVVLFVPAVVGLLAGVASKQPGFSWGTFWKGFAIAMGVQVALVLIAIGLCSGLGSG